MMLLPSTRILSCAIITFTLQYCTFGAPLETVFLQTHDSLKEPLAGRDVESLSPNSTIPIAPAIVHSLLPRQTTPSRQSSPFGPASHFSSFHSGSKSPRFDPVNQSPVFSSPRDETPLVKLEDDEYRRNRRVIRDCPSKPGWKFRMSRCVPSHGPRLFAVTCTVLGYEPGRPQITLLTHTDYTGCREGEICIDAPNHPLDNTRVHCVNHEYHLKTAKPGQEEKGKLSGRVGSVVPRDMHSVDSGYENHSHASNPRIDLETSQHGALVQKNQAGFSSDASLPENGANHFLQPRVANQARHINQCPAEPTLGITLAACVNSPGTKAYHTVCQGAGHHRPSLFTAMGFCAQDELCVDIGRYESVNQHKRAWCIKSDHVNRIVKLPIRYGLKEQLMVEGDAALPAFVQHDPLPVPDTAQMAHEHRPGSPLETIQERALDGSDSSPGPVPTPSSYGRPISNCPNHPGWRIMISRCDKDKSRPGAYFVICQEPVYNATTGESSWAGFKTIEGLCSTREQCVDTTATTAICIPEGAALNMNDQGHQPMQGIHRRANDGGNDTSNFAASDSVVKQSRMPARGSRIICPHKPTWRPVTSTCNNRLGPRAYRVTCKNPSTGAWSEVYQNGLCRENERCEEVIIPGSFLKARCVSAGDEEGNDEQPTSGRRPEELSPRKILNTRALSMQPRTPSTGRPLNCPEQPTWPAVLSRCTKRHSPRGYYVRCRDSNGEQWTHLHGFCSPNERCEEVDVHNDPHSQATASRAVCVLNNQPYINLAHLALGRTSGQAPPVEEAIHKRTLHSSHQRPPMHPERRPHSGRMISKCPTHPSWTFVESHCLSSDRRGFSVECQSIMSREPERFSEYGSCAENERCLDVKNHNGPGAITRAMCVVDTGRFRRVAELGHGRGHEQLSPTREVSRRGLDRNEIKPGSTSSLSRTLDKNNGRPITCPSHPTWRVAFSQCIEPHPREYSVMCGVPVLDVGTGSRRLSTHMRGFCEEHERCVNVDAVSAVCVPDTESYVGSAQLDFEKNPEKQQKSKDQEKPDVAEEQAAEIHKRAFNTTNDATPNSMLRPRGISISKVRRSRAGGVPIDCPGHPNWVVMLSHCHTPHPRGYLALCEEPTGRPGSYSGDIHYRSGSCAENQQCVELEVGRAVCMSEKIFKTLKIDRLHKDRPVEYRKTIEAPPPPHAIESRAIARSSTVPSSVANQPGASVSESRPITCPDHPDWRLMFSRCILDHSRDYYAACQKPIHMPNAPPRYGQWQDLAGRCDSHERCVNIQPTRAACVIDPEKLVRLAQVATEKRPGNNEPPANGLHERNLLPTSIALQTRDLGNVQPVTCPGEGRVVTSRCLDSDRDYSVTCDYPTFKSKITGEYEYTHRIDHHNSCAPRQICKHIDSHTAVCMVDDEKYIRLAQMALAKEPEEKLSNGVAKPDSGPSSVALHPRMEVVLGRPVTCHGPDMWVPIESHCLGAETRKYWIVCQHRNNKDPEARVDYNALCHENEHCVQASQNRALCMPNTKGSPNTEYSFQKRDIVPSSVALQPRMLTSSDRTITCHGHPRYIAIESHCMGLNTRKYWVVCHDKADGQHDTQLNHHGQLDHNAFCHDHEHCVQVSNDEAVCRPNTMKPVQPRDLVLQPRGTNSHRRTITCHGHPRYIAIESHCMGLNTRKYWVVCRDKPDQHHDDGLNHNAFCRAHEHCVQISSMTAVCESNAQESEQIESPSTPKKRNIEQDITPALTQHGTLLPRTTPRPVTCPDSTAQAMASRCLSDNPRAYWVACKEQTHESSTANEQTHEGWIDHTSLCHPHERCVNIDAQHAGCITSRQEPIMQPWRLRQTAQGKQPSAAITSNADPGLKSLVSRTPVGRPVVCPHYPHFHVLESRCHETSRRQYSAKCSPPESYGKKLREYMEARGFCDEHEICEQTTPTVAVCMINTERYVKIAQLAVHGQHPAEKGLKADSNPTSSQHRSDDIERRELCQRDPMGQCLSSQESNPVNYRVRNQDRYRVRCPGHPDMHVAESGCVDGKRFWATCLAVQHNTLQPISPIHTEGSCTGNEICVESAAEHQAECVSLHGTSETHTRLSVGTAHSNAANEQQVSPYGASGTFTRLTAGTTQLNTANEQQAAERLEQRSLAEPVPTDDLSEREVCQRNPMGQCVSSKSSESGTPLHHPAGFPIKCPGHPGWIITGSDCIGRHSGRYWATCHPPGERSHGLSNIQHFEGYCPDHMLCKSEAGSRVLCVSETEVGEESAPNNTPAESGKSDTSDHEDLEQEVHKPEVLKPEVLKPEVLKPEVLKRDPMGGRLSRGRPTVHPESPELPDTELPDSSELADSRPVGCVQHPEWLVTRSFCVMSNPAEYFTFCEPSPHSHVGTPAYMSGHKTGHGHCEEHEYCKQVTPSKAVCAKKKPSAAPPRIEHSESKHQPQQQMYMDLIGGYTHTPLVSRGVPAARPVMCPHHPNWLVTESHCLHRPREYSAKCQPPPHRSFGMPISDELGACSEHESCHQLTSNMAFCVPIQPDDAASGTNEPETQTLDSANPEDHTTAESSNTETLPKAPPAAADTGSAHLQLRDGLPAGRHIPCPNHPELTVRTSQCRGFHPRQYLVTCEPAQGTRSSRLTPWFNGYGECEKGERCQQVTPEKAMCVSKTEDSDPSPEEKKLRGMPRLVGVHAVGM